LSELQTLTKFFCFMKYSRLTKEQFEALHVEFINFLATQSITGAEWKEIKANQPALAEQELDVFSDLIWEGALGKAEFLQNASAQQLFLFRLEKEQMQLVVVRCSNPEIDLTTSQGLKWLFRHVGDEQVELLTASKGYAQDRNQDIFQLIQQGAEITDGKLFEAIFKLLPEK